jgi:hypothetical protein
MKTSGIIKRLTVDDRQRGRLFQCIEDKPIRAGDLALSVDDAGAIAAFGVVFFRGRQAFVRDVIELSRVTDVTADRRARRLFLVERYWTEFLTFAELAQREQQAADASPPKPKPVNRRLAAAARHAEKSKAERARK